MASLRGRSWREDWDQPAVGALTVLAQMAREAGLPWSQPAQALSATHGWALLQKHPWEPQRCCHRQDQFPEPEGAT